MKVLTDSIIYLASSILNRAIPFLLLPILTFYLSPEEYGILSIFLIFITFYNAFIGMNITTNISKNFFNISKKEMASMIGNILIILSLSCLIYFIITIFTSLFFSEIFSIPSKWFIVIPIISLLIMINMTLKTTLRNEGKALLFGVFEISHTILNMGITILLLIIFSYGWHARIFGMLYSYLIFVFIAIIYLNKEDYLTLKINKNKIKSILKVSVPLIPHALGGIILTMSDRIFIEKMINIESVGIYSVGYTFGMITLVFTESFIKAWSPWFYKTLSSPTKEKKVLIVKYSYLYILSVFILAICIAYIGKIILPFLVDSSYYDAAQYILWISLGYAMFGTYQIIFPYLVHINRTSFLGFSTAFSAGVNLILNYYLIQYYGAIGAAYATFLSYFLMFILISIYAQKNYPMPWLNAIKS